MILGLNHQRVWELANKQKFFLKEVRIISDLSDLSNSDIDTLIKLDDRYNELGKLFLGPIFFSHIKNIIPITKKSTDSIEQLYRMFPEINVFMR
jgi:hypothetical protein